MRLGLVVFVESATMVELVALPNCDSLSDIVSIFFAELGLRLSDFVKVENFRGI